MAQRTLPQKRFLNLVRPVVCKKAGKDIRLYGRAWEVKRAMAKGLCEYRGGQGCRVNAFHFDSTPEKFPGVLLTSEQLEKVTEKLAAVQTLNEEEAKAIAHLHARESWVKVS